MRPLQSPSSAAAQHWRCLRFAGRFERHACYTGADSFITVLEAGFILTLASFPDRPTGDQQGCSAC